MTIPEAPLSTIELNVFSSLTGRIGETRLVRRMR